MRSRSKLNVSREAAQAVVAATFGGGCDLVGFGELTEGYFNAAYLLELDDGRRCVLKVAPPDDVPVLRYEREIMAAEAEALALAAARTAMPVPGVYAFDRTRRHLPSPYLVMAALPGEPLHRVRAELAPETQTAIDRALGTYLAQLNAIAGPGFGYLAAPAPAGAPWSAVFLGMLRDVLADGETAAVPLPVAPAELMARAALWAADLDQVREPRLVHWDLWDGNVFVERGTGRVTGIIDFERALWGDPLLEVQFRAFAPGDAFSEGYGARPLDAPGAYRRRVLYNLYLYLIMIIECTYRHYETDDQERWARERLGEELARLA